MSERGEPGVLSGIAATSLVVAAARAAEQRRPDRLFEDPFAELFLRAAEADIGTAEAEVAEVAEVADAAGMGDMADAADPTGAGDGREPPTGGSPTAGSPTAGPVTGGPVTGGPVTGGPVTGGPPTAGSPTAGPRTGERTRAFLREMGDQPAVRTAFLDELLLGAARAGCRQVVLLAAGMDTRAFRLNWPEGTRVFDVDFAEVLRLKLRVLGQARATPRCDHRPVAVDLRADWGAALRAQGFSPGQPTAWLAEGILYALPPAAADLLLDRITALSAPGSLFAADHIERSPALDAATATMSADLVNRWQSGPAMPLESWLARYRWTPQVTDLASVTSRYGRPVPAVFDARRPGTSRGWLVAAERPR